MTGVAVFVDDDASVLDGLRRGLRELRSTWDLRFAYGGPEAVELLDVDVDVVVSDMRMPVVDGVEVLRQAQQLSPRAARVILSGQSDARATRRAVGIAHRFLAKPCQATTVAHLLREVLPVVRSSAGPGPLLVADRDRVARVVARVDRDAHVDEALVELVLADPAVTACVLHAASSAFFGAPGGCSGVEQALHHLGGTGLSELLVEEEALTVSGSGAAQVQLPPRGTDPVVRTATSLASLQQHATPGGVAGLLRLWGVAEQLVTEVERQCAGDA